jgi:hypothetical protein
MLCLVAALLRRRRRRSKSVLTIPERASAAAASLRGRLRAKNRRGVGGGDARSTGEEGQHNHNMKPEQYGVRNANGNIITVGRRGSSSMGRRLRGGSDMQTRNGNLISDLVGNTRPARHLGTTTGNVGPRKGTLSYVY